MTEQGLLLMHRSLATIARLEVKAFMEETKSAIDSLSRQREGAAQAIALAHQAKEIGDYLPDDTEFQLSYVSSRLNRLEAALKQVNAELDELKEMPASPCTQVLPALLTPLMKPDQTGHANCVLSCPTLGMSDDQQDGRLVENTAQCPLEIFRVKSRKALVQNDQFCLL
jgi:hypothetical protein